MVVFSPSFSPSMAQDCRHNESHTRACFGTSKRSKCLLCWRRQQRIPDHVGWRTGRTRLSIQQQQARFLLSRFREYVRSSRDQQGWISSPPPPPGEREYPFVVMILLTLFWGVVAMPISWPVRPAQSFFFITLTFSVIHRYKWARVGRR